MKTILLIIWHDLICNVPIYSLRRLYFVRILRNTIHRSSALHRNVRLFCHSGIDVGSCTTINRDVTLDGRGSLLIGNNVSISEGVKIVTASHSISSKSFDLVKKPVVIRDYVWICINAIILPGVEIGEGAVVAAGSVVTRNVPPYTVVAGNPAVYLKTRIGNLHYNPSWFAIL